MLRAFTRNPWRCFSGVFPCCLHPDLCWELWSSTLGSSGAIPWETVAVALTPISVRFNLLHKCVTCQWEVIFTVVYVPQAKMSNPQPQNTGNHETKGEEGRKYMWHRMRQNETKMRRKRDYFIALFPWCTRCSEFFGQALLLVFVWENFQTLFFLLQPCSNCSLCFWAATRGQGQKRPDQWGAFPLPVLQDMVFGDSKTRDPKYFSINIFPLKRCFRHLSSPSLAFPHWPDSAMLIQIKFAFCCNTFIFYSWTL